MVSKLVYMMLWVVFLLGGWFWCPGDACLDEEKTALLQLKPFFNSYKYSYVDGVNNWGKKGSDCCEWEKVECNNFTGRVIQLYLNHTFTGKTASGYFYSYPNYWEVQREQPWHLNVSLFLPFEELQSLYLGGNFIAGFLDHQGFEKKLEKLEILDMSYNYFDESIFASLSELPSLKYLYLAGNHFDGSNPNDGIKRLSKLKNLETLDLHENYMFGNSIVSNLRNFTSLRSLSLQGCGLQGTFEMQEFNNLVNLKELYLSYNEIESLGSSFQGDELRLKKLEVLGLRGNNFDNSIFSTLASLPNLKSLDITDNRLEGPIRIKDINALSTLEQLYMWDNQVNEFVPSQGNERLMNLKALDLRGNLFNNSILTSLGNLSNLKSLGLGGPKFRGSIDLTELNALTHLEDLSLVWWPDRSNCSLQLQSLALFPALKRLRLSGINFEASIRMTSQDDKSHNFLNLEKLTLENSLLQTNFLGSIGHFTSLKHLTLYNCEMNGSLSLQDDKSPNFSNLEEIYVFDSFLQTNFLGSIGHFTSLKHLVVDYCKINGSLSLQGLCEMPSLQELKFSVTNVEGSLPDCFSNLTSLQTLDLSHNHFSGNISALQTLTSLQTLDLSHNHFSGNISPLQSLTSLQLLRLSDNNFQIPISLEPLFNLSKLQYIDADNTTIFAESQTHSLGAPAFQLKQISLSCCGDVGSFPEFLYYQRDLEYLDLSNIFFKGNQFPFWLLENNTRLQSIDLANSSLSGPLLLPLTSHMGLSSLEISNNFINDSIPMKFGAQLPSLRYLNMSKNHFNGSIPSSFGDMTSLDTLDLSNNQLSGGIPEQLAMSCPVLKVLALSNNTLEGNIFSENFNLTSLTELHLDGNNFSGWIPDVLSKSTFLSTLDVGNNHLSGGIPRWMGNMSSLDTIIVSNNHLQGKIPIEFCQLDQLILLDISVNNISGSIPSCFSSSWQITQVHLSKNRLRGTLPSALSNSSTLVTLDISHNFFIGTIPSWIGGISTLSYLLLSNNLFHGEIPMEICMLNQLSLINLSRNNLSGRIPPCLKITTLEDGPVPEDNSVDGLTSISPTEAFAAAPSGQFSLNEAIDFPIKNVSNSYKGRIIPLLSGIDLSCNKLVGEIPYEFGNFYKMIVLNLSHNSLTGPIPPSFANLKQIESLDLSYNKLSGSIPPQLVRLNFLAYFIVSFNNLSGKTPPRAAQFGTFDESSYRGNPFLCGEPLPKCGDLGPSSPMPNSSTDDDKDDGFIDMEVFHVSFVVSYMVLLLTVAVVLYINPYWRKAWFYYAETTATSCYYFVLDNILPKRSHF